MAIIESENGEREEQERDRGGHSNCHKVAQFSLVATAETETAAELIVLQSGA